MHVATGIPCKRGGDCSNPELNCYTILETEAGDAVALATGGNILVDYWQPGAAAAAAAAGNTVWSNYYSIFHVCHKSKAYYRVLTEVSYQSPQDTSDVSCDKASTVAKKS